MTSRSQRLIDACGTDICSPAAVFLDSCSTDQEYYDGAEAHWLMWGAAHREQAAAKDIFDKAFKRYPTEDVGCQLMVEAARTAAPARLRRIQAALQNCPRTQFTKAARCYVRWLLGDSPEVVTKITTSIIKHAGDKEEFGVWLRTELTFEIWSRGIED